MKFEVFLSSPSVGTSAVAFDISMPTWDGDESVCLVIIGHMNTQPLKIRGADPLNALASAVAFVESNIATLCQQHTVAWENGVVFER